MNQEQSLLTKCPHCLTLFRVEFEQLQVANGEVRCGVCFKIFNARKQGVAFSEGEGSDADTTFGRKQARQLAEQLPDSPAKDIDPQDIPTADQLEQLDFQPQSIDRLVTAKHHDTDTGNSLLWTLFSLIALFIGACQWAWFNRDDLATESRWRHYYLAVCEQLGCQLPDYKNPDAIQLKDLAVRSHPNYDNALRVELTLTNLSSFSQPLPDLSLAFYDINGMILAQRELTPREYLSQSTQSLNQLDRSRPLQISFAILDPGTEAANYRLQPIFK